MLSRNKKALKLQVWGGKSFNHAITHSFSRSILNTKHNMGRASKDKRVSLLVFNVVVLISF